MAKCGSCGGQNGGCGCVMGPASDGGAGNTPSVVFEGAGTNATPYRAKLNHDGWGTTAQPIAGFTPGTGGSAAFNSTVVGKEVTVSFAMVLGTGFVLPASPVVPLDARLPMAVYPAAAGRILGVGTILDVSASAIYTLLVCSDGTANNLVLYAMGASGQRILLGPSSPFVFAAGDTIEFIYKYTVN